MKYQSRKNDLANKKLDSGSCLGCGLLADNSNSLCCHSVLTAYKMRLIPVLSGDSCSVQIVLSQKKYKHLLKMVLISVSSIHLPEVVTCFLKIFNCFRQMSKKRRLHVNLKLLHICLAKKEGHTYTAFQQNQQGTLLLCQYFDTPKKFSFTEFFLKVQEREKNYIPFCVDCLIEI